ncbi:MAG: hypothetical protein ACTH8F_08285 [Microbacterium sp.]|uniref:hypothetical protein n=1 Tax=Microbacterium sp. TaxID=51671 RepID=UPI003F97E86F
MTTFPFPSETISTTDPADIIDNTMTGRTFRAAIGTNTLWCVGAHEISNVPGRHQLGGLLFKARILPMTKTGRGEAARSMAVLVSLTPADEIDVEVRRISDGHEHAHVQGIYIDQMQRMILALDYDGADVLNPRYW